VERDVHRAVRADQDIRRGIAGTSQAPSLPSAP
jgi:hypothetical protein